MGSTDGEVLTPEQLLRYDENVKTHTEALNERRSDPITLKPFQVLACLMTEAYLDRVVNDREAFLANLNEFVNEQNEKKGRIKFPEFDDSDLDKLAFWMATGSGKTLLMHINYYQYLDYVEDSDDLPENILLVTPNEGLSEQHIEDLRESSIPCHHFNAETIELQGVGENPVKVIEIQKLVEEKSGEGLSVEVESFGHNNLVSSTRVTRALERGRLGGSFARVSPRTDLPSSTVRHSGRHSRRQASMLRRSMGNRSFSTIRILDSTMTDTGRTTTS